MGGCRFCVGLRRLLRGGLQGFAGACQYLRMAACTPRGSAGLPGYSTRVCRALPVLCGGSRVLTGTCGWLQVLRGFLRAPQVFRGGPRGSAGIDRYLRVAAGTPRVLRGGPRVLRGAPRVLCGPHGVPRGFAGVCGALYTN